MATHPVSRLILWLLLALVGITGFQSRYSLDVPAIMAGLTLATLPIVTVYIFGQRYFVRGLVSGAVKGE